MNIGNKIQKIRMLQNVKQEDLAMHLNISQATLSKIENNNTELSVTDLEKIANYFKTPIDYFFKEGSNFLTQNNHDNSTGGSMIIQNDKLEKLLIQKDEMLTEYKTLITQLNDKLTRRDKKIDELKSKK